MGCKAGDKCLFPHYKVDEQPNKNAEKGYYFSQKRESDDKNAVAVVKSVPQLGCVSQDSEALVSQSGKQSRETRCKKSWNPFEGYDSLSPRYVNRVSGEKWTIAWKNKKSKFLISEVPTLKKIEDRSHEETARQQRGARSKAWNLVKKYTRLEEKDKAAFHSPAEEWVLLAASTKKLEERKSL